MGPRGGLRLDEQAGETRPARRLGRRGFLRLAVGAALVGGTWRGWAVSTRGIVIERRRVPAVGLTAPLRLVILSDLHARHNRGIVPHASLPWVEEAISIAARQGGDLFFVLGDLTVMGDRDPAFLRRVVGSVETVPARYGRFACLGNHDVAVCDALGIRDPYAGTGIRMLDDEWVTLPTDSGAVAIGGVRWTWEGWARSPVLRDAPAVRPRILLAHDPAPAEWMRDPDAMDLILSGHTHGGQIRIPFVEEPWIRGSKYVSGTYALGSSSYLHVNRGIGTVILPLRFGSRPEVTVIDLVPAPAERES